MSFEDQHRLTMLSDQMRLPFAVLSDPERETYRAYRLSPGSWRQAFGWKTIWAYIRLLTRGRRYHFMSSDLRQLGGDFVIDSQGIVRFAHPSSQPSDRPSVEKLLQVLKGI